MADDLKVVLVDDSKLVIAHLSRLLESVECVEVVGTSQDGASAIRSVAHHRPDLVLMDIVMPGMDGLSALRVMRATQPDCRVVMISSMAGSGSNAEEAFRLGAIQVIAKPFEADQIAALMESEAEFRREQREGTA
jgi:two-component system chemotaxis response regulator CheY